MSSKSSRAGDGGKALLLPQESVNSKASSPQDEEKNIGLDPTVKRRGTGLILAHSTVLTNLKEDTVFEAATDYNNWKAHGLVFSDLPRFDDSTLCGLSISTENDMIRKEIAKYMQFAQSSSPALFDSGGILGYNKHDGADDLSIIIDQIRCNLEIIKHDNAWQAVANTLHGSFYEHFRVARDFLSVSYATDPHAVKRRKPKTLNNQDENRRVYHSLIDFIFGSSAWWILRVTQSESTAADIIAVLARWAVKLKVIELNPVVWADKSLEEGGDTMRSIANTQKDEAKVVIKLFNEETNKTDEIPFEDGPKLTLSYYISKFRLRTLLLDLVSGAMGDLIIGQPWIWSKLSAGLVVRTFIYKGGLDQTLRQLSVEADGRIRITPNLVGFKWSYIASRLLLYNCKSISERNKIDSKNNPRSKSYITSKMGWHHIKMENGTLCLKERGVTETQRVDDLVSVLVPLSFMANSDLIKQLTEVSVLRRHGDEQDEDPLQSLAEDTIELDFVMSALESHSKPQSLLSSPFFDSDVIPSTQTPLFKNTEDLLKDFENDVVTDSNSAKALRDHAKRLAQEYMDRESEWSSWVISEDSIRVRTRKYSFAVLTIAIVIIFGSLAVPLTIGERMAGVDPFDWVTFAWLLAGAFLVGAKSRYVVEWPWHSFLRGHSVCQSVSELAEASRITRQTVLLYLLHNEFKSLLTFQGPCSMIFTKRTKESKGGFNIDIPIEHATVLAAGFIVLKICKTTGVYLLLQDGRDDVPADSEGHSLFSELDSSLLHTIRVHGNEQLSSTVQPLKKEIFHYGQATFLGQYTRACTFL